MGTGGHMLKNLILDKPLAFIDVETTGLQPNMDRIVELSILKIHPDGNYEYKSHRMNPGIPIPAEATAIHGITDEDVVNEPVFQEYASSIIDFLEGCDIAGFNVLKFDIPFLEVELRRAGVLFQKRDRKFIDVQILYHLLEPRDLKSAYLKYCGKEMELSHTAQGDATAAAEILDKQLEIHQDLPKNVEGLHALCQPGLANYVDPEGKFIWSNGEIVCHFGRKYFGWTLKQLVSQAPDYLQWMLSSDFSPDVKKLVYNALQGKFPKPKVK